MQRFRRELRAWLSGHPSADVIDVGSRSGSDAFAFETLRACNAATSEARRGGLIGSAGCYEEHIGPEIANLAT